MNQDELELAVARAALDDVVEGQLVGAGTGSTARFFIDELARIKQRISGAEASSGDTKARLEGHGIKVYDLNDVTELPVYIDGADEINAEMHTIKGGGALTREKIVAAVADKFACIVDASKYVPVLGSFPLPIEVIPMARAQVARELMRLDGQPVARAGFVTDNGNLILDVKRCGDMPKMLESIEAMEAAGLRVVDSLQAMADSAIENPALLCHE